MLDGAAISGGAGAAVLAATLVAATAAGLLWRRANGRFRRAAGSAADEGEEAAMPTGTDLGAPLGERATLVQFSSAFCQPCRATRRVLAEVAAMVDGVAHIEVDAEARLDLVRALDIMRTPTVLVLDSAGRIRTRASGQPRRADVIAAIGAAVD
ncbi:thiol-disulfide isomerase/thioredoxin [Murinocardiopsis flavida]|uniref:Thiol-disulfide isomerase/thioredoxin n=1 Tax=Murinocardiopsis flavida TaxID=645275 RepID=A0A2P8DQW9_9ACTN|nr:thiol-disulfide isomerase/thioredoxin [Murinocardiopsis flavida]